MSLQPVFALLISVMICAAALAADPFADTVVEYVPGDGVVSDFVTGDRFDDPTTSLGAPTRFTSDPDNFGGPTTPFQAPFRASEVVTVGEGGVLEVAFDEPVTDDPRNPFGIDLLVFGNAFLGLSGFPADETTTAINVGAEGGVIEVSSDGVDYVVVPGVDADGLFPTLGFRDVDEPFPTAASAPTDFTLPVDPALEVVGLTTAEIVAAYNGSGGGAGIDLADVGLSAISFVRITNPVGSGVTPEIDAFADVRPVPEPSGVLLTLLTISGLVVPKRRATV